MAEKQVPCGSDRDLNEYPICPDCGAGFPATFAYNSARSYAIVCFTCGFEFEHGNCFSAEELTREEIEEAFWDEMDSPSSLTDVSDIPY